MVYFRNGEFLLMIGARKARDKLSFGVSWEPYTASANSWLCMAYFEMGYFGNAFFFWVFFGMGIFVIG